jgi:hypothetical protein
MNWEHVLADWRKSEEEAWRPFYAERGFRSWLEWRESYIRDLKLARRTWEETVVSDPHLIVPTYAIGGYRAWYKYRPSQQAIATFEDVAVVPVPGEKSYVDGSPREDVATNLKVSALLGNLQDTTILALRCGERVAVVDGTHRCAAIALENTVALSSKIRLTVRTATLPPSELGILRAFCSSEPS